MNYGKQTSKQSQINKVEISQVIKHGNNKWSSKKLTTNNT